MNAISEFFSFIFSPVQMFFVEVFTQLQSAVAYVATFLMTFLRGVINVIQAVVDLFNFGNY